MRRLCVLLALKQAYIKAIGQPMGFDWSRLEFNIPDKKATGDGRPLNGWEFRVWSSELGWPVPGAGPEPAPGPSAGAGAEAEAGAGEEGPARVLCPTGTFGSFVLWHPDIPMDEERDEYLRSLTEWTRLAAEVRCVALLCRASTHVAVNLADT